MLRNGLLTRCLVAACVAAASCARQASAPVPPAPSVRVTQAAERTIHPLVVLSGLIAPLQNVDLTTNVQEPTDAVYVAEGDVVHRGQVLARLDTADLTAAAAQAAAHLQQTEYQATLAINQGGDQVRYARAGLAQAESNLRLARVTLSRDEQLLRQGFIDQQTVDTQRTQVAVDEKTVAAAQATLAQAIENEQANGTPNEGLQKANIEQARAALEQIQAQIARAVIVSPVNGIVVNRNLNPGEYPGTRQIFTLQEIDNVYAVLNAYGSQIAGIAGGAGAILTASALPARTFRGRVVAVLPPTSPASSGFIVKVQISNPDGALRPGMTVTANVEAPPVRGIAVPRTAFLDDTHQTVMTVHGGVAHVADVTEVAEDPTYAVVTGLPAGTQVVANGQTSVVDGQKVAVR
jgi:multidrug efflux pump subunit AcrA (membrane-fusion protein)